MTVENRNRIEDYRPPPFPDDFGERLEGLKKLTGLSWGAFADLLGVTQRGLLKWRRGGPPSGVDAQRLCPLKCQGKMSSK